MMQIAEKLAAKARDNFDAPGVTIAFLGDSVTQGCFELYEKADGVMDPVFDRAHAYHTYLSQILATLYPTVPVNIINAGVSSSSALHGLKRLERDVLRHHPDLTVVCFGLNDCGQKDVGIPTYIAALTEIFDRLQQQGSEIIFMTPNMMCTCVSPNLTLQPLRPTAEGIARLQNDGVLTRYLDAARALCKEKRIPVCDVYLKWQAMARAGVDVTELLSNKVNHPTREMNWLFAYSLMETMLA